MKILLISFSTLPTLQKYMYNMHEELGKLGHDVYSIGSASLRVPVEICESNLLVATPETPRPSISSLRSAKSKLDTVLDDIERIRPDVIHFVNKHVWNYLLRQRARWRRIDALWVHTFHDPIGHEGDSVQKGVVLYHKLIQRQLNAIVVHSGVALSQTREVLKPRCPVVRAPLGEKQWKDYEPIEQSAAKRLLVFGRLNHYKGCEMYPDIFNGIYSLDPEIHITVAGQPSKDLDSAVLASIARCPNVKLDAHYIEERLLSRYFREAAIVLAPYTSMTQSGVLLDAYRASRTVVAFGIRGMDEFLPGSAKTARPFDIEEFVRLVVELANDLDACQKAGREAWQFGKEQFAPASMASRFAQLYRDLAQDAAHASLDE